MSALASPCSAVLPLPKLPPLSPALSSSTFSGGRREIVRGMVVGVQGQIGFDAFEPRDHAGEGAHVLSETCNRGPRRNAPVPAARHDQLGAGAKLDRRSARGAGRAASCGRSSDIADGRAT